MNPRLKMRGYGGAALVVLTATVAYLMVQQPLQADKIDAANSRVSQTETQVQVLSDNQDKLIGGMDEANRRLVALGKSPVPVPSVSPAPAPVQPDELTEAEAADVRRIVAQQLAGAKVTQAEITQIARVAATFVPKPADGKSPTAAQIQPVVTAAVAAYCAGDRCRAPAVTPPPGPQGARGEQGEKGEQGPKVSDEELLAATQQALTAYCGQESKPCDGTDGTNGTNGTDAPVVKDMDCVGDDLESHWLIQFDKGPEIKALGPCRIGPDPN